MCHARALGRTVAVRAARSFHCVYAPGTPKGACHAVVLGAASEETHGIRTPGGEFCALSRRVVRVYPRATSGSPGDGRATR